MSSLLQNLIDRYPEAFDHLFFFVRLGLIVYIAVGLFPLLRKHVLNWSNSNTNAPRPLNSPSVYNTQQAAQYLHSAQPVANAPQSANAPAVYNTQQPAQYLHSAQPAANAPQSANAPSVYNTQQAALYLHTPQPAANAPRTLNTPAADNTQPVALYTHTAQPAANTPQSLNTPRPLNAPTAYNTQQAAHYTSQTQPSSLRIPSPEQFVAKLIRLYRASIIYVRIGHSDLRIACIPALLILAFLFLFR